MTKAIVIVGASGFGRETLDVIEAIDEGAPHPVWNVVGVTDDATQINLDRLAARRVTYVGTIDDLVAHADRPGYVVGIGSPAVRQSIVERLNAAGLEAATLVHPAATIGHLVNMGPGRVDCCRMTRPDLQIVVCAGVTDLVPIGGETSVCQWTVARTLEAVAA